MHTKYLVLLYISLLSTPSKHITIHNLHKKKIFIEPCLRGANLNPPTSQRQRRGIQGGDIVTLIGSSMSQNALPHSSNPPPPSLEDYTYPKKQSCSSKNHTQFNTLPSDILHTIGTWNFRIVHHNKFNKVLVQITQQNQLLCSIISYKLKYVPFANTIFFHKIIY